MLSDRDGDLDISEEELRKLLTLVDEDERYYFTYMGTAKNELLEELLADKTDELQLQESCSIFHMGNGEIRVWLGVVPKAIDDEWVVPYALDGLADQFKDYVFKED